MTPIDTDLPLPDDIEAAHRLIRELIATLRQQTHLNDKLQHQLEQLLRQLYGRKSEKLDPNQLLLFAREILEAAGPGTPEREPTPEPASPSRRRNLRPKATAASPCRRICHANGSYTTSRSNSGSAPIVVWSDGASARKSASNSNTCRRR